MINSLVDKNSYSENMNTASRIAAVATIFATPLSTSIMSILYIITMVLILLSGHWRERFQQITSHPIALLFMGFFIIFIVGLTYSAGSWHEALRQLSRYNWLLLAPLLIPLFSSEEWRRRAINAFLLAMIITLIFSYAKYFGWATFGRGNASVFKNHIIQNFLMAFADFIFIYRWIHKKPYRWNYALVIILMTINIMFMSEGRSGYVVFGAFLLYSGFYFYRWKGLIYTLIGFTLMVGLAYTLSSSFNVRINQASVDLQHYKTGDANTSLGLRMLWIKNGIKLIEKQPFIGYGTGAIKAAYATLPDKSLQGTPRVNNIGNEYFNFAVQFGLLGLLYFLAMFYLQWRYSAKLPDDWKFITQILLIGIGLGNFANSWLTDTTQAHLYAMLIFIAFAALPRQIKEYSAHEATQTSSKSAISAAKST